jgi:hypothetical protein
MAEEIYVDFDAEDDPVVTVKGVKGRACKDLTRSLEKALGTVISDKPTPEMREEDPAHGAGSKAARNKR